MPEWNVDSLTDCPVTRDPSSLTDAEQRVLAALAERSIADFSDKPPAARQIRASFLQALISGSVDEWPLCCPLRVRGAEITGQLRPPTGRQGDDARAALLFWSCRFDSVVDLSGSDFLTIRMIGCELPAFIGASLTTKADLDLSGSRFAGVTNYQSELTDVGTCAVHLNNARIGGQLLLGSTAGSRFTACGTVRLDGARVEGDIALTGARLDGNGEAALSARSAVVGGNADLEPAHGHRVEATGEVAFAASRITGDLRCNSARLTNPQGRALHCEDLIVESVFLTGQAHDGVYFEARGRLNFLSATIGGSFFLSSARLAPGPDLPGLLRRGGPIAANLQQIRVSNALIFNNVGALTDAPGPGPAPLEGWVLLTSAQLNGILDNVQTGWPAPGFLDLEGASYERIGDLERGDVVSQRIRWLRLQFANRRPSAATFRPQPYEELTRVLRQHGLTREADAIAVEKIRMRLASRVDRPWARIFPNLLMLAAHHGYSSSRAVLSFIIFVLLGAVMYATALFGHGQTFVPTDGEPEPAMYSLPFDLARVDTQSGCPGLDVLHYALDSALPVVDLAQDTRCQFTPVGPARRLWLMLHSLYVIAGTALSAVVVLTLTGVLRRD